MCLEESDSRESRGTSWSRKQYCKSYNFGNQEMWQYQSELFRVAVPPPRFISCGSTVAVQEEDKEEEEEEGAQGEAEDDYDREAPAPLLEDEIDYSAVRTGALSDILE